MTAVKSGTTVCISRRMFLTSGFAVLSPGTVISQVVPMKKENAGEIMVRNAVHSVAIDNVCAWPCLVPLHEGIIAAIIHNQPSHGQMEGDVECHVSRDGGRTWKFSGISSPHEKDAIRMNHAAGVARDGALVVLCSGWGGREFREFTLPVMVSRSYDDGVTWDRSGRVILPAGMSNLIPYGRIIRTGSDMLAAACYDAYAGDGLNCAYLLVSMDDGYTWEQPIPIVVKDDAGVERILNINETALLSGGRNLIVAAARVYSRDARLLVARTDSRGRLWSIPERYVGEGVTGPAEHPGHLLRLKSGMILLTYGIRHEDHGIGARVGYEDGTIWGPPFRVFSYGGADNGYPSSLELGDGMIATAFYSCANRCHNRYYMGMLHWNIPVEAVPHRG